MADLKEVTQNITWINCDHEIYRIYEFLDGKRIRIDRPVLLNVSKSGGHRILDANNVSHYIPYKWIHLFWETDDNNAFRF